MSTCTDASGSLASTVDQDTVIDSLIDRTGCKSSLSIRPTDLLEVPSMSDGFMTGTQDTFADTSLSDTVTLRIFVTAIITEYLTIAKKIFLW
ncbi:hypothetical protein [Fischerella thermalis]|uniref:hypothetical protein n=1 Tax=Fischerella thermalis TaxID=372787 RepID=UPI00307F36EF